MPADPTRVIRSRPDITLYVAAEREPNGLPLLVEAIVDCIGMDAEAPSFGDDWGPWLTENYPRLRTRAVECLSSEAELAIAGGQP